VTELPTPSTPDGREGLAALLGEPQGALLGFDFDGTLAPIVDDPTAAHAHPDAPAALAALAGRVALIAVMTGRPASQAVELGGFAGVPGLERLVVLGQYGFERWDINSKTAVVPEPPAGLDAVRSQLPRLLEVLGLPDAHIEDKGIAVAVHVRRMDDPAGAFHELHAPMAALASRNGLSLEPGRLVLELRAEGMDKGEALRGLLRESGARSVMFVGDDLGDVAAFDAVDEFRAEGGYGLLVCSGSVEQNALVERSDLVVDGPPGVVALLRTIADALPKPKVSQRGTSGGREQ
jgi:trehalose 6-phosphate phosphatase